jgi:hypothetical protein
MMDGAGVEVATKLQEHILIPLVRNVMVLV